MLFKAKNAGLFDVEDYIEDHLKLIRAPFNADAMRRFASKWKHVSDELGSMEQWIDEALFKIYAMMVRDEAKFKSCIDKRRSMRKLGFFKLGYDNKSHKHNKKLN